MPQLAEPSLLELQSFWTCYHPLAFLLYRLSRGCLSRKHCWKRKSKQNPYAATQPVGLSLYTQLLTSSGILDKSYLSLKPAQPRPPVYRRGRATIPCPLSRFGKICLLQFSLKGLLTLYENGEPIS